LALYKFEDKQDIVTQPNKVPPILVIIGQMPFLRGGCIIVCAADSDQGTLIARTLPSHTILRLRIVEQPLKWVAHPLGILIPLGSPPQEPSTISEYSPPAAAGESPLSISQSKWKLNRNPHPGLQLSHPQSKIANVGDCRIFGFPSMLIDRTAIFDCSWKLLN